MKIWLIGDTHFNHKKLLQYENRPKDFNRIIIQNWNKVVSTDDIVIHLGDVILGQDSTLKEILGNCLGRKILTRGNHDHHSMQWYMQRGFDFACDYFVYKNIAFSHAPLTPLPFRTSDENYNKQVSLNIHAHFHHGNHRGKPGMPDKYFDHEYFDKNRMLYYLIQIEDTLKPVLLDTIVKEVK